MEVGLEVHGNRLVHVLATPRQLVVLLRFCLRLRLRPQVPQVFSWPTSRAFLIALTPPVLQGFQIYVFVECVEKDARVDLLHEDIGYPAARARHPDHLDRLLLDCPVYLVAADILSFVSFPFSRPARPE